MWRIWLAFAILASAQDPIRVSTRLVETHVVVRDRRGAVRGLTVEDFKLQEDGKPQRVAIFRVSEPDAAQVKAELPKGVFSNRRAGGTRQSQYRVLLIDSLNTEIADQENVRAEMLKMLGGIKIHDPTAIYTLRDSFQRLQDFTTDVGLLE